MILSESKLHLSGKFICRHISFFILQKWSGLFYGHQRGLPFKCLILSLFFPFQSSWGRASGLAGQHCSISASPACWAYLWSAFRCALFWTTLAGGLSTLWPCKWEIVGIHWGYHTNKIHITHVYMHIHTRTYMQTHPAKGIWEDGREESN